MHVYMRTKVDVFGIEKVFDRVDRRILCMVLKVCGVSEKLVKIIRSIQGCSIFFCFLWVDT